MSRWSPRVVLACRAMRRRMHARVFDDLEAEMRKTFVDETLAMRRRTYEYLTSCQGRPTRVSNVVTGSAGACPDLVTFDDGVELRLMPGGSQAVRSMAAFLSDRDEPVMLSVATGGDGAYRLGFAAGEMSWTTRAESVDVRHAP